MNNYPGHDAIKQKGWLKAHQWLLLRRFSQLLILTLFFSGPWFGVWILKGNLSSSLLLNTVPMTDPLLLLQVLLTQHWPEMIAFTGTAVILVFYLLVGGRMYCSWVCPLNMVTDAADWVKERLGVKPATRFTKSTRYGLLVLLLLLAAVTGTLVWELVNPVSLLHRGLLFGIGFGWFIILGIFLFDIFIVPRGWCGHLCPVGAFYGLLGGVTPVRISTANRTACDNCMDCFHICPEPQVITPALKDLNHRPLIDDAQCTNCGRCIDVCSKHVFHFSLNRYLKTQPVLEESTP